MIVTALRLVPIFDPFVVFWLNFLIPTVFAAAGISKRSWRLLRIAVIIALPATATAFFTGVYWYVLPWTLLLVSTWLQYKQRARRWIVLAALPWVGVHVLIVLAYSWMAFIGILDT